jgi:hypothetical protein
MSTKTDDDDELWDERRYVRVPLTMMDGLDATQRAVARASAPAHSYAAYCADHAARLADYRRLGAAAGHRPGVAPPTDKQRQARMDAICERNRALADAWRGPARDVAPRTNDAAAALAERDRALANAWRAR